jgi:glycosyltransferase involved in cell wall biosynthesis
MKILVFPRDRNPYQGLLYDQMHHLGAQITYIGELTPSRTLNILLLPLEVGVRRVTGARLIHLHWVFAFALPGVRRFPVVRRIAQFWFLIWLTICRMLGMHLVWTVHNVLPHEQVFANDASARRALVAASDLVLAHSKSALAELAALGAVPVKSAVIEHGPIGPTLDTVSLDIPGATDEPRRFLFFGRVHDYKGVEDLLTAFMAMPHDVVAHLTVAGQCSDSGLRSRLSALARSGDRRVTLRLERIPDGDVSKLLAASDVVVLPFRRVTTSGSAMLALCHGRPLIVPDLPGLADLPGQAVLRYDGQVPALIDALVSMARADAETLATMSAAALHYASRTTWDDIAEKTMGEMLLVLGDTSAVDTCSRIVRVPRSRLR